MRIDHYALRVADRHKTAKFFIDALKYKIQEEFDLPFDDGTTVKCIALEPPEKMDRAPWKVEQLIPIMFPAATMVEYHMAPEIFISSSEDETSIVGEWVKKRGGIGGLHHIALMVDDVEATMQDWKERGYAEFTSEKVMECGEGSQMIKQIFTKPSALTGFIFELINRGDRGFCSGNVKKLMESTRGV